MDPKLLGVIIGGLAPAIFYTAAGLLSKSSNQAQIGLGPYLLFISLGVAAVALIISQIIPENTWNSKSATHAGLLGISWALGSALVAVGLVKYNAPIAKLAPLYNLNTLFTTLLGLWIFSEWTEVDLKKLLIGSVLMIIGGVLVTGS